MLPEIRYGVEIEVQFRNIPTDAVIRKINEDAGIQIMNVGYTHNVLPQWKVLCDGSLGEYGREFVSPILSGEDGLQQVYKVISAIRKNGGYVDNSCGLHVHCEVPTRTTNYFRKILWLYASFEEEIDKIVSTSRRKDNNGYCKSMTYALANRYVTTEMGDEMSMDSFRHSLNLDKYKKVNFSSFWSYGTIEFRHHHGTLNFAAVSAWIRLVLSFMEKAKNPLPGAMLPKLVVPETVQAESRRTRRTETNYRQQAIDLIIGDFAHMDRIAPLQPGEHHIATFTSHYITEMLGHSKWGTLGDIIKCLPSAYELDSSWSPNGTRTKFYTVKMVNRVSAIHTTPAEYKFDFSSLMDFTGIDLSSRAYLEDCVVTPVS